MTTTTDSFNQDVEKNGGGSDSNEGFPRVDHEISHTSFRHDNDHIYINNVPISKHEFTNAFGGTFEVSAREKTRELKEYGNPVPAGLGAFAASALSLGLVQMHARSVTMANTLLGAFLTTSGLVEIIVGILCFIIGNTWASCTFLMFGGFWSSYSFVLMDVGNISTSYASEYEFSQSIGIFFLPWVIFSFTIWLCTWRSTFALSLLIFLIFFFVLLFTIAQFIGSVKLFKAGGFFCILAGCVGFYNMLAGLADKTNSYFIVKPINLPNMYVPEKSE